MLGWHLLLKEPGSSVGRQPLFLACQDIDFIVGDGDCWGQSICDTAVHVMQLHQLRHETLSRCFIISKKQMCDLFSLIPEQHLDSHSW